MMGTRDDIAEAETVIGRTMEIKMKWVREGTLAEYVSCRWLTPVILRARKTSYLDRGDRYR